MYRHEREPKLSTKYVYTCTAIVATFAAIDIVAIAIWAIA
jgi:hypothetical protein